MAEKKKMSVAEILAAARKADGGGGSDAPTPEPPAPEVAAEAAAPATAEPAEAPAVEKPAAKAPAPKLAPGQRPSVADILAQARANKSSAASKPASKEAPAPKKQEADVPRSPAAAKPAAAAKAAPAAKSAVKAPAARLDTSSILAAARAGHKPGPVSKADAPQKPEKAAAAPKAKLTAPPMPARPDYAQPKPALSPAKKAAAEARRTFVFLGVLFGTWLAVGFTALATVGGLWTLAFARFMFPNFLTEPPSRFKVGFPGEFPPGQVSEKFKAQFGVWVVNYEYQGTAEIFALASICTHLGCTPNWLESEQKFKCPCHGSGYYKDGVNFEGPAPRPLERYAIRLAEDGQLEVDKSRKFQEELGQWKDPASFVSV